MEKLRYNEDLIWQSDWNGYEVGYDDVPVVGLYQIAGTETYLLIDIENDEVLEKYEMED